MNFQNLKNLLSRHLSLVLTAATFIIFAVMAIGFAAADAACAPEELNVISEQVTSLNAIQPMPTYSENGSDGSTIYAVSIEDIGTVNTVTAFNYADEIYTETGGYVVNTGTGRTKTGTIKILLKNLDPTDEDFEEKAASLDRFSDGLYWKVTLYIPAVFSSCNIYVNYALTEQIGSIEGYDFSYFSEKELVSETHTDGTSPSLITLSLKNDREKLTGDSVTDGCVVTIHYESSCAISGILGNVLIGEKSAVKTAVSNNSTIHFPIAAAGILVFALFIFICILKRTASFMPPLLLSFGIFLYHSCRYALTVACSLPVLTLAMQGVSLGVIALSAALSCKLKIKKLDLRIPMSVLAAVCIILGLLYPWYNLVALNVTARIIGCVLAAATIAVQVINAARKIRNLDALSATASSVFLLYISLVQDTSNFLSPSNWLCFMMLLLIICIGCSEFVKMERASVNYTKNLKKEVEAQTNSLQTMLDEREDLLRFVSHDMRKPVKAMDKFLATLSARERDAENMKTIGILQSKTQELGHSLDELSRYSKINYIAEEAETFDCSEITDKVYGLLGPDCSANGIIFNYTPANIMIFAKRKSLESILTNLIINAIEHSDCTEIALAAEKKKDKCIITVADNGNGIESSAALFSPYGGADDEHGLGLYICRRYAEAMNSSIAAERRENLTIFYVTLPLS